MKHVLCTATICAVVMGSITGTLRSAPQPDEESAAAGIIIEAEHFTTRNPDNDSFAVAARETFASGGRALAKFFPKEGRCVYRLTISRAGTYQLWLRYAANSQQKVRFSVNADPGKRPLIAALPATGKLAGQGAWKWGLLGKVKLRAGVNHLTLHGSPLRADCFWISAKSDPPDSRQLSRARLERAREHLRNPIELITPNWLDEADDHRLPAWYATTRVCAHTRLNWQWRTKDPELFFDAGQRFASLGLHEFVRHIKSGSEPAWWESEVGAVMPEARGANPAKQIIDEAHAAGCRILVYYRHMEDTSIAAQHPEWTARDHQGNVIQKRGPKICFNTPYADFVQRRLIELAEMGADGFYFDEVHMPKPFCWCKNCQQRFEAETQLAYPRDADPFDPAYQKAIDFKNVTIERVFRRWQKALHEVNPDAVLVIGSNTYPQMVERHTTHRLYRIADSMKTEFALPARASANRIFALDHDIAPTETDARLALGYAIARDACDGRPPHVWIHGLPNATHAKYATAGVITHGGIANLDHPENTIPDPVRFKDAIALGNRMAPALAGTQPIRWGAVHYSEYARDHYLPDESRAWQQVLYPVYGAFTTLLRSHLPVGIVTDSQLEQGRLDGCHVLFIPAREHLTRRMQEAIARFTRSGGQVVYQKPEWHWHDPRGGMNRVGKAFLEEINDAITSAPLAVRGGAPKMHAVFYTNETKRRVTVALVNDFSWVFTGRTRTRDGRPIADLDARINRPPPPPCKDVQIILRTNRVIRQIRNVVTNQPLTPTTDQDGYRIDLPAFRCVAVVTIDFE